QNMRRTREIERPCARMVGAFGLDAEHPIGSWQIVSRPLVAKPEHRLRIAQQRLAAGALGGVAGRNALAVRGAIWPADCVRLVVCGERKAAAITEVKASHVSRIKFRDNENRCGRQLPALIVDVLVHLRELFEGGLTRECNLVTQIVASSAPYVVQI